MRQAANDSAAVHNLGHPRQMLADADSLGTRLDFAEFSANSGRSIRPEVPHVDGGGAARKPNHDHGASAAAPFSLCSRILSASFHLQKLRQGKAKKSRGADLQEVTPGEAFTIRRKALIHDGDSPKNPKAATNRRTSRVSDSR